MEYVTKYVTKIVIILLLVLILPIIIYSIIYEITHECEFVAISELKSWNGISDRDTGLFSRGSVNRNTLMFENGLVYDWNLDIIIIGRNYQIEKCTHFMGSYYGAELA